MGNNFCSNKAKIFEKTELTNVSEYFENFFPRAPLEGERSWSEKYEARRDYLNKTREILVIKIILEGGK